MTHRQTTIRNCIYCVIIATNIKHTIGSYGRSDWADCIVSGVLALASTVAFTQDLREEAHGVRND